ncbi:MAG: DUF547 domain-containing protein [Steroidobacteraceae bacterium]
MNGSVEGNWLRTALAAMAMAFAPTPQAVGASDSFDQTHGQFDRLLRAHVHDGRVDYAELHAQPSQLEEYVAAIGRVDARTLAQFSREQQMAYWINAYNAFTLQAIVDNYPLRRRGIKGLAFPANSIWQIPGVWKGDSHHAGGRNVSLDGIEHGILRPRYSERRVHFALVCASLSCPDLRSEAYRADRLEQQLQDQTRRFVADAAKGVRIDHDERTVHLSSIFKWFGEDFARASDTPAALRTLSASQAGVLAFVQGYVGDARDRALLASGRFHVEYLKYDWRLNEE